MKNYFKKFSIMFVMALILVLGCCTSAFATDDGVVGTANLNGTTENSATVGVKLTAPEVGWKRYNNDSAKLLYDGFTYFSDTATQLYKNDHMYSSNGTVKFKFYGSKLRIIGQFHPQASSNTQISIDGKEESYNEYSSSWQYGSAIVYENLNLDNGIHTVIITTSEGGTKYTRLDAIDIDSNGVLILYDESITLDKSTMNLTEGDSQQLTATTTPAGAQVTWTSSDESIATVDSNGKVTGVKEGTGTITATTTDGVTATCIVTVTKENESISLNKSTTNLTTGDSETLIATTTPSAVSVTWTSSDTSVATVDSSGKITAIGAGITTITATTTDGSNLSASCIVNVTKGTDPNPEPTGSDTIVNTAYAKGDNTNNASGGVSIIFNGEPDTTLSVVKTANVKSVWVGDNFTYTIVVTNTGSKTAKSVVINDSAPNHIQFTPSGITTTQGTVDSSSTSKNIIVNVGDIPPSGIVTIIIPSTVIL